METMEQMSIPGCLALWASAVKSLSLHIVGPAAKVIVDAGLPEAAPVGTIVSSRAEHIRQHNCLTRLQPSRFCRGGQMPAAAYSGDE
jgi:hypothetical protein